MRLIDADLLKENCKIDGSFENNFQCVSLDTLGRVIDKQATAYDIDKVINKLKANCRGYTNDGEVAISLDKAIEIIERYKE